MIINKQIIAAVAVIFDEKGKIALGLRDDPTGPHYHNKWGLPAGIVDPGEYPATTAVREAKEEVGLDIELLAQHPVVRSMIDEDRNNQVILLAYPAKVTGGDFAALDGTKDVKWATAEEIDEMDCLPFCKEFIDEAKKLKEATI